MAVKIRWKKEHKDECDSSGSDMGAEYNSAIDFQFGMGDVNPIGGPDKFGYVFGQNAPKKRFKRKKKR